MKEKDLPERLRELGKKLEMLEREEDEDKALELLERATEEAERFGTDLEEGR